MSNLRNLVRWRRDNEREQMATELYESSHSSSDFDDVAEEVKLLETELAVPHAQRRAGRGIRGEGIRREAFRRSARALFCRALLVLVLLATLAGLTYWSQIYWSLGSSRTTVPPPSPNIHTGHERKALVIASWSEQDVAWLSDVPDDWEIHRYVLDDSNPASPHLTVPRNQGREAMVYITYILDNWGTLPDYTVFVHGHDRSWHQVEPIPLKLAALNLTALDTDRYVNLRCTNAPGCSADTFIDATHVHDGEWRIQAKLMPGFWATMFPAELDYWGLGPAPTAIGVPCCAQFAVSREAIELRPRGFWEMYRRPLERDLEEYVGSIGEGIDGYTVGMLYEKVWHIIFGKEAVHCPAEGYCRGTQWSDAITCDWYPELYKDSEGWENITCALKEHADVTRYR